jgi:transcriptional regulator GlxA family with amidase domain
MVVMACQDLAMSPKTPPIAPTPPRAVEILTFPAVQLLDVAGPLQVFASANEQAAARGSPCPYRTRVVAPGAAVAATAGLVFATEPLPPPDTAVDTLVLAGGQGVLEASENGELLEWVRARAARARRVASVCTGAFLLGAAGLLDGRRAVTHWDYCARLARRVPRARIDPDPIFIRDGSVWTSAGVTAGIDLSLALVEEDLGRALALAVARHLVVYLKRPGGQAQFSAALTLQSTNDRFASLHEWINAHLADDLPLARLAAEAGMSERSFSRRYQTLIGLTPARAVERLRVEAARTLVTETRLPLKQIATRCGFGSEETLRRSFLRVQGVGPQEFRIRFAA